MPNNNDLGLDRPEPPEGKPAAYNCEHGPSNVPCLCHYATAMATGQPQPKTLPNNWYEHVGTTKTVTRVVDGIPLEVEVPEDGGMTDSVNL